MTVSGRGSEFRLRQGRIDTDGRVMSYLGVKGVGVSPCLTFSVSGFPTIRIMIKSMSEIENVGAFFDRIRSFLTFCALYHELYACD